MFHLVHISSQFYIVPRVNIHRYREKTRRRNHVAVGDTRESNTMPVGCLSSRHVESTLYLSTSSSSSSSNPAQENNHSQVILVYSGELFTLIYFVLTCSKLSFIVIYSFTFFYLVIVISDIVLLHFPFLFYHIQTSKFSIFLVFLYLQPDTSNTMNSAKSNSLSVKHQRLTPSGCRD